MRSLVGRRSSNCSQVGSLRIRRSTTASALRDRRRALNVITPVCRDCVNMIEIVKPRSTACVTRSSMRLTFIEKPARLLKRQPQRSSTPRRRACPYRRSRERSYLVATRRPQTAAAHGRRRRSARDYIVQVLLRVTGEFRCVLVRRCRVRSTRVLLDPHIKRYRP